MAGLLDEEELLPVFSNQNIARQGARARALATKRDVNTLPDPRTYAAVQGLLGTPPDEMGFSVLNPNYESIQRVARPAFAAGTALGIAPLMGAARFSRPAQQTVAASQRGAVRMPGAARAPQEEALRLAQQRAALPIEQGGLGLPPNNTPMDRARAMGFDVEAYHGTTADIRMFSPEFRGEATGAQSAKKAYFLAADPLNPPAQMLTKAPANSESVQMLKNLGIPEAEIAKLNQVSMKGHGAETASGYAQIGGSRDYKEAMRKANAAEKAGNWGEYEKWMTIAEDAEIGRNRYLQGLVAKYGDARDTMLAKINDSILSKKLPQGQAVALDAKMKQLMPYGWYNSYSIPQLKALKTEIVKLSDAPEGALKSIDDFISVKAERQLAENTQQGSNVMPLMVRSQNPMNYDFGGSAYRDQSYADLIDKAANAKNDILFLRNTFDPGAGPAKLIDVLAVRDPSRIRSRFAAFDPFRLTPAIAATMGVAAPDLLARTIDDEERREQLLPGLLAP